MRLSVWVVSSCGEYYSDPVAAFDELPEARRWAEATLGPELHGTGSREDPIGPNWTIKGLIAVRDPQVDVMGHR